MKKPADFGGLFCCSANATLATKEMSICGLMLFGSSAKTRARQGVGHERCGETRKIHQQGPSLMNQEQPNNPLHGIKLAAIVEELVEMYGWEELGYRININCFNIDPSVKSSLKFLRKTPWAREKVERLYLRAIRRR